jgi:ABC-2 type transport system ATP-binding protein
VLAASDRLGDGAELAISVHGLRKSFGSNIALDGLDLAVPMGVVYGFLGPNGAGKTTTMRILTTLTKPESGSVEILGQKLGQSRKALREVGALIEIPSFYPFLTGRENMEMLAATGAPVEVGRIEELLEMVGLGERASDKVSGYSLGMKQRLGIARALLSRPRLLLLDEPAKSLDPLGVVAMRKTLRRLAAEGTTVFVSSHLLSQIRQMADYVGIIANGKMVREGSIDALLGAEGHIRVRVPLDKLDEAFRVISGMVPEGYVSFAPSEPGWLDVRIDANRTGEITRTLVAAGIDATGIETGTDLERLFLELTANAGAQEPKDPGEFYGLVKRNKEKVRGSDAGGTSGGSYE